MNIAAKPSRHSIRYVRLERKMKDNTLVWVVPSSDSFNRPANERITNALSVCQIEKNSFFAA